jgi:oligopeptide transport system substrate-binding protein
LLADAGYPNGENFPPVKLMFNTEFNDHKLIAEIVSRQWKRNLNINIELDGMEVKQFATRLHEKDYDVSRASWYGDYNDVSTFTDKYRTDSLNNDSGWSNAEYDRLTDAAKKEVDPQKRLDLLSQAEQILVSEVPIIPLYHYVNKYAFRDNVKGIPLNPRNMVEFKRVTAGR